MKSTLLSLLLIGSVAWGQSKIETIPQRRTTINFKRRDGSQCQAGDLLVGVSVTATGTISGDGACEPILEKFAAIGVPVQNSGKSPLFVEAPKPTAPVSITLEAPLEHSTAHCACEFTEDGKLMTCTPINACVEEIMRKMADTEPIEVPAIQVKAICRNIEGGSLCTIDHWTCADKSRILEHSEDGKMWCRKVQP